MIHNNLSHRPPLAYSLGSDHFTLKRGTQALHLNEPNWIFDGSNELIVDFLSQLALFLERKGKGGLARPLRICACVPLEEILWLPGVRGDTLTCRPRLDNSPKHLPLFTVTFNHYLTLKCKSSHKNCVEEVTAEWVSKALPRHICCLKHGSQQTISARTGQTSVLKGKF